MIDSDTEVINKIPVPKLLEEKRSVAFIALQGVICTNCHFQ